ncbi:Uncharacterized protein APZ42_033343 [Daphnia magna]|uniref:Uncharacterized protein n=1 Tax=Daphnia magna TaxID=35525 RepID=A0A164L6H7_9CRUS|nr:Uncharacterized protein APZ42_033343 [Daphnia magna]
MMKTLRDEMHEQRANITFSHQRMIELETSKAMKKHKDDILIELRRSRVTEQGETPETGEDSSEGTVTARSRHSSNASVINISCDTRDDLTAERDTLMGELMGAGHIVRTSKDKKERRVNTLKAQSRHDRIVELTRKLAGISTADERTSDREQLDVALSEIAVLEQLAEPPKRDPTPTTTTLVNRPALPLPVFSGDIAAWES